MTTRATHPPDADCTIEYGGNYEPDGQIVREVCLYRNGRRWLTLRPFALWAPLFIAASRLRFWLT